MTDQTKKAIELTEKIFGDAKIIFEWDWNQKIRKPNFNPTLRTVAKYMGLKKVHVMETWEDEDGEEFTVEKEWFERV